MASHHEAIREFATLARQRLNAALDATAEARYLQLLGFFEAAQGDDLPPAAVLTSAEEIPDTEDYEPSLPEAPSIQLSASPNPLEIDAIEVTPELPRITVPQNNDWLAPPEDEEVAIETAESENVESSEPATASDDAEVEADEEPATSPADEASSEAVAEPAEDEAPAESTEPEPPSDEVAVAVAQSAADELDIEVTAEPPAEEETSDAALGSAGSEELDIEAAEEPAAIEPSGDTAEVPEPAEEEELDVEVVAQPPAEEEAPDEAQPSPVAAETTEELDIEVSAEEPPADEAQAEPAPEATQSAEPNVEIDLPPEASETEEPTPEPVSATDDEAALSSEAPEDSAEEPTNEEVAPEPEPVPVPEPQPEPEPEPVVAAASDAEESAEPEQSATSEEDVAASGDEEVDASLFLTPAGDSDPGEPAEEEAQTAVAEETEATGEEPDHLGAESAVSADAEPEPSPSIAPPEHIDSSDLDDAELLAFATGKDSEPAADTPPAAPVWKSGWEKPQPAAAWGTPENAWGVAEKPTTSAWDSPAAAWGQPAAPAPSSEWEIPPPPAAPTQQPASAPTSGWEATVPPASAPADNDWNTAPAAPSASSWDAPAASWGTPSPASEWGASPEVEAEPEPEDAMLVPEDESPQDWLLPVAEEPDTDFSNIGSQFSEPPPLMSPSEMLSDAAQQQWQEQQEWDAGALTEPAMQPVGWGISPEQSRIIEGDHRIAVHTLEGAVKRGITTDLDLSADVFTIAPAIGQPPSDVLSMARTKALFFLLQPGETPPRPPPNAQRVRVTFVDNRQVEGFLGEDTGNGFFLFPVDNRTNNAKVFVFRHAVLTMS